MQDPNEKPVKVALTKDHTKTYNTIHPRRDKKRILKVSKIKNRSQKIRNKTSQSQQLREVEESFKTLKENNFPSRILSLDILQNPSTKVTTTKKKDKKDLSN